MIAQLLRDIRDLIERCDILLATVLGERGEHGKKLDAVLEILRAWVAYRMQIGTVPKEDIQPLVDMLKALGHGDVRVQTGGTNVEAQRDANLDVGGDLTGGD